MALVLSVLDPLDIFAEPATSAASGACVSTGFLGVGATGSVGGTCGLGARTIAAGGETGGEPKWSCDPFAKRSFACLVAWARGFLIPSDLWAPFVGLSRAGSCSAVEASRAGETPIHHWHQVLQGKPLYSIVSAMAASSGHATRDESATIRAKVRTNICFSPIDTRNRLCFHSIFIGLANSGDLFPMCAVTVTSRYPKIDSLSVLSCRNRSLHAIHPAQLDIVRTSNCPNVMSVTQGNGPRFQN